jgi:hypothetical protein
MIHKSHTKKDLIEIIDIFNFGDVIENYKELNKDCLSSLLGLHLRTIAMIIPNKDYYDFDDITDLRTYLAHPSPKQVLTIKEKDIVIDKAKKIIFYCRIASYCLGGTTYDTIEEVIQDAYDIRNYGDIPTIRRALKLLRQDSKINQYSVISPVMTYRMQQRLELKERLRQGGLARLSVRHTTPGEEILLSFD